MPAPDNFSTVFAVPMHCGDCVASVEKALNGLDGIQTVQTNLADQLVTVYGNAPPSSIIRAVQGIGKDAIVRGTGESNSAAVCIVESFEDDVNPVKGLARIVALTPTKALFDISLNGLPRGTYYPSIRQSGDLSKGPLSTGSKLEELAEIKVGEDDEARTPEQFLAQAGSGFSGQATFIKNGLSISDIIGRGLVISKAREAVFPDSLVGVIARSAGAWENMKTVCSCSGKTVWEERADAVAHGIN